MEKAMPMNSRTMNNTKKMVLFLRHATRAGTDRERRCHLTKTTAGLSECRKNGLGSSLLGYNANGGTGNGSLPAKLGDPASSFVAVTDITGVPSSAVVGTPLTLTGSVAPSSATNKSIKWTVKNAGTTGASIAGNVLTASDPGTVMITATIDDGKAVGTPFTKEFTITVKNVGETTPDDGGGG
jgi:uncharacterized protein YjdB